MTSPSTIAISVALAVGTWGMFGAQAALLPELFGARHRYIGALTTHARRPSYRSTSRSIRSVHGAGHSPIDTILNLAPVVPVLILDDPETAVVVGRALVSGGLPGLEVTLRTEHTPKRP